MKLLALALSACLLAAPLAACSVLPEPAKYADAVDVLADASDLLSILDRLSADHLASIDIPSAEDVKAAGALLEDLDGARFALLDARQSAEAGKLGESARHVLDALTHLDSVVDQLEAWGVKVPAEVKEGLRSARSVANLVS